MINKLDSLIAEIDSLFECVQINFESDTWRDTIPSEAGWYLVKTNTPLNVLKDINSPKHSAHINIPQTIKNATMLHDLGIAIKQWNTEEYVVYNGEADNLKARAREHVRGHAKTFCLGLLNYETLHKYRWSFCYTAASSCESLRNINKPLRLAIEQGWRAKHGWPILCRK